MEDWDKRSDLTVAPENCCGHKILDQLAEGEIELHHPKAPPELRHKAAKTPKEAYIVYQQTGVTDPKNPVRYKKLDQKIEKVSPHIVKMKKDYLLRRRGVSFRYNPQWENAFAWTSSSTKQTEADSVAEDVADGLPIGAEKPSLHSERRAFAERSAWTTTRSPEKQKRRRIAESSSDSKDTADDPQTPTATMTAMELTGSKPEARTATEKYLHENEDAGERTPEVSSNDGTLLRRLTQAWKAVTKLGVVKIRRIQENEGPKYKRKLK